MIKKLKSYTIIPPDLYVQRDADRQLREIIDDLGRPGYVLVSRQMGKTNLLLNAKRELESGSDLFVYIDLSNPFGSAKSCFENIIDTALESSSERFSSVTTAIVEQRKLLSDIPAHKQHTNELRQILKSITGKLVIILDEIDALTKTNYSDQIFSQIRSIYFSRINNSELERLTYILSGVIEPTDIIKDPKISPFNIGQKIFLNDFSKDEFNLFIKKSDLKFSNEVKDQIYSWTNGNPRMTWDLCSAIEDASIAGQELSILKIDQVVNDIYLTTFDKPPIDNIRGIVQNDRDIRLAIVDLLNARSDTISDKIKNKLYLSGIINYNDKQVEIKNRIIKQSLSIEWLTSLEIEEKGFVSVAMQYYSSKEFKLAIEYFEKYLAGNEFPDNQDKPHYYYIMGHSYFKILEFEKAIKSLDKAIFEVGDEAKWYYKVRELQGLCLFYLQNYDESLSHFKEVIDSGRRDDIYIRSLLNYGAISLQSRNSQHADSSYKIFNSIILEEGIDRAKLKEDFFNELKSIAYYNIAQIQSRKGDKSNALINFTEALSLASTVSIPNMSLKLLSLTDDKHKRHEVLEKAIDTIVDNQLKPIEKDPENPLAFSLEDLAEVVGHAYIDKSELLFAKIRPKVDLLGDKKWTQNLYEVAIYFINTNQDWDTAGEILRSLYNSFERHDLDFDEELRFTILKVLTYLSSSKTDLQLFVEYAQNFKFKRFGQVDYIDFDIFANLILQLNSQKKYTEALEYAEVINSVHDSISDDLLINYLAIYNLELNSLVPIGNRNRAIEKAKQIISLAGIDRIRQQKSNLLGETGYELIRQNAERVLNPNFYKQEPIKSTKIYDRNDYVNVKFKDGSIQKVKYKKIEDQIKRGECVIVN